MADCIWFKDKTCFMTKPKDASEFDRCRTCIAAADLADRSGNYTLATDMGPQ